MASGLLGLSNKGLFQSLNHCYRHIMQILMFLINSKCGMDRFLEISCTIRVTELCAGTDVHFSLSSVNLYANQAFVLLLTVLPITILKNLKILNCN